MMIEQRGRKWPLWEECSRKKGTRSVLGECCRRNLSLCVQWWVNHGHVFSEQTALANIFEKHTLLYVEGYLLGISRIHRILEGVIRTCDVDGEAFRGMSASMLDHAMALIFTPDPPENTEEVIHQIAIRLAEIGHYYLERYNRDVPEKLTVRRKSKARTEIDEICQAIERVASE